MTYTMYVDDTAVIRRKFEVPERCPRCKRHYKVGDTVMRTVTLRPREEMVHLSTLIDGRTLREVVSIKDSTAIRDRAVMQVLEIRCLACDHLLASAHSRMYILSEMDQAMASKLCGLLYDSNANDDLVQRKCFDTPPEKV